jgi:hypothetical protein
MSHLLSGTTDEDVDDDDSIVIDECDDDHGDASHDATSDLNRKVVREEVNTLVLDCCC